MCCRLSGGSMYPIGSRALGSDPRLLTLTLTLTLTLHLTLTLTLRRLSGGRAAARRETMTPLPD